MKKIHKILLIPIITAFSYVFNDDPNTGEGFNKLSFKGRMVYYYKQIMKG